MTALSPNVDSVALVSWLASREVACPTCGYNLHGLPEPRCPECGCDLALRVGPVKSPAVPWTLLIVLFALAIAFDLVTRALVGGNVVLLRPPTGLHIVIDPILGTVAATGLISAAGVVLLVARQVALSSRRATDVRFLRKSVRRDAIFPIPRPRTEIGGTDLSGTKSMPPASSGRRASRREQRL